MSRPPHYTCALNSGSQTARTDRQTPDTKFSPTAESPTIDHHTCRARSNRCLRRRSLGTIHTGPPCMDRSEARRGRRCTGSARSRTACCRTGPPSRPCRCTGRPPQNTCILHTHCHKHSTLNTLSITPSHKHATGYKSKMRPYVTAHNLTCHAQCS